MNLNQYIIKLLKKKPENFDDLYKKTKNFPLSKFKLNEILNKLINNLTIFKTSDNFYFVPNILGKEISSISLSTRGFGFIETPIRTAIILSRYLNGALNEDIVEFKYFSHPFDETKIQAFVTNIIERKNKYLIGKLTLKDDFINFEPLNIKIIGSFNIMNFDSKIHFNNDIIKVEIMNVNKQYIALKIIKKMFNESDNYSTTSLLIEEQNIKVDFPKNIKNILSSIPNCVDEKQCQGRKDLTNKLIVTIDGEDTKDFDDAIYVEKKSNDNFVLYVSIADVSYYVKPNSLLDQEAYKRATSIYLVDQVVPMLPFELSNGICSLVPNQKRLAITCEMEINTNGKVIHYKIYESVIESKFRLTYEEVNNHFANDKKVSIGLNSELSDMLSYAGQLSNILFDLKNKNGYINFNLKNSKIIYDYEHNKVLDIKLEQRAFSEIMIENFMVLTNEVIAEHLSKQKIPIIFRIHDKPSIEKLDNLSKFLKNLNLSYKLESSKMTSKKFANLLEKVNKNHYSNYVNSFFLQTMAKAIYSPKNLGHFGLANEYYCHFTSPIRRYPDLIVHQILRRAEFCQQTINEDRDLENIAKHCSDLEIQSSTLENKVKDMKMAEYFNQFINKEFQGEIVGMKKNLLFVDFEHKKTIAHGSVDLKNSQPEFKLINNNFAITNGKITYKLGQKLKFKIISTSKFNGNINLNIV